MLFLLLFKILYTLRQRRLARHGAGSLLQEPV
jgi:hypothetical protein